MAPEDLEGSMSHMFLYLVLVRFNIKYCEYFMLIIVSTFICFPVFYNVKKKKKMLYI